MVVVGQALALGLLGARPVAADPEVTYHEHIAGIVYARCAECHRPGQAGPFPLLTYQDVSRRASTIQAVVNQRYMPPWHPVEGYGEFRDSRRLSDQELSLLNRWIDAGRPEGDPALSPPPPVFPPDGWQLGVPDLVIEMSEGFAIPADGRDIYRSFVIPLNLDEDKWVRAIEFRPSARSAVHHSLFFLDGLGLARARDARDAKPGFSGMIPPSGRMGGYTPGNDVTAWSDGLGLPLPQGSDFVLQTHFHPTGKPEVERSKLGLYFLDGPSKKTLVPLQVPPGFGIGMGIDIPPGETNYTITDELTVPVDVECHEIGGHAHYICKTMKMTAHLPDGRVEPLLYLDNWDLNWQGRYRYKQPVALPAGTVLKSEITYDNSADNPRNPYHPPRRIRWGRESNDEMGSITVTVTPRDERDAQQLVRTSRRTMLESLRPTGQFLDRLRNRDDGPANDGSRAAEALIRRFDANGDGKLQRDEVPERFRGRGFDALDTNGDGVLDAEELKGVAQRLLQRLG